MDISADSLDALLRVLRESRVTGELTDDGTREITGAEKGSKVYMDLVNRAGAAARRNRKAAKASMTITIEVTAAAKRYDVSCDTSVKFTGIKLPKQAAAETTGWIDEEGNLLGQQPSQPDLPFDVVVGGKDDAPKGARKKTV